MSIGSENIIPKILTRKELAEYLRITEKTVDRLKRKAIPFHRVGRTIRFNRNDVLDYLESVKVEPIDLKK